ncbi:hypothetical protein BJX61DRAFT_513740 [Aspergillus egyptiacus]|nr:hypothetical protein BJX61DRAFT_513740 [Aspergillus egyptiacus]
MDTSIESLVIVDEESKEEFPKLTAIAIDAAESEEKLEKYCAAFSAGQVTTSSPFKRWVNSLRLKKASSLGQPQRHIEGWPYTAGWDGIYHSSQCGSKEQQWEQLSGSSHLGTVKTALSIASQSVARSRRTTQSTHRSRISEPRISLDSTRQPLSTIIDEEAENRAAKRRRVLQEIVTTESDYIFDLKALTNLLVIISGRPEIYHNVQRLRDIHESFLSRIRKISPISSLPRAEFERIVLQTQKRPHAVDLSIKGFQPFNTQTLRLHKVKPITSSHRLSQLAAETNEALKVAQEIGKLSKSFIHYKEFCKSHELLSKDTDLLRKTVKNWPEFEQGIEALTKSAASIETRSIYENKSLCLNDILIKPAQRLCKYPLLLEELLKWTHIQDDPTAHDGIRQALESVREVLAEINEATSSTLSRTLVEKTLLLQEMFDSKSTPSIDIYKQLGPMTLCGVLHVTYQAITQITGAFMVCVLFKHHLLVAKMNDEHRKLQPLACLYISDARIDSLSNGKGLEYFCIFSWKLSFQFLDRKFEFVLSASSAAEEKQWKAGILKSAAASADVSSAMSSGLRASSFLVLNLVPVQDVSNLAPQLSRRPSLQTLGMPRVRSSLPPIIIKKTHCPHKHGQTQPIQGELDRPKLPLPGPTSIITARRQDRTRLERAISPIYTRDALPYPGMFLARGDILFGRGSIMRHLSIRPKRYRRSSSINLPLGFQILGVSQDGQKLEDQTYGTKKQKRRDASEISHSLEHEKGWTPHKDVNHLWRSMTVRVKSSPTSSYSSSLQPDSKEDKSSERSEIPSRKGIWSIFNSMSLRWTKKAARPSV